MASDGTYSFDPENAFFGSASFPYKVCDANSPTPACTNATAYFLVVQESQNEPLPVKLLFFSGRQVEQGNLLTWATAIERNSAYFDLRHSTNGSQFKSIAVVTAAGNSDITRNYQYVHTNPVSGNNFYQLVSVDKDGRKENSKIINITARPPGTVVVYPNPAGGVCTLSGDKEEISSITLLNALGVNVTRRVQLARQSDQVIQINLSSLSQGIYYLKTKTQRIKIIKLQ